MASDGHAGSTQDEWDLVWQDFDRRRRPPRVASRQPSQPAAVAVGPRRSFGVLLVLACILSLAPNSATLPSDPAGRLSGADALAALLTLAPQQAELPPLSTSVSRLALESARAACWVQRLDPRGQFCADDADGD